MKKLLALVVIVTAATYTGSSLAVMDSSLINHNVPSYGVTNNTSSVGIGTSGGSQSAGYGNMAIAGVVLYKAAGYVSCPVLTAQSNAYPISAITGEATVEPHHFKDGYYIDITTGTSATYTGGLAVISGTTHYNGTYAMFGGSGTSWQIIARGNGVCTGSGTPYAWCTSSGNGNWPVTTTDTSGTITMGSGWALAKTVGPLPDLKPASSGDYCYYAYYNAQGTATGSQLLSWTGNADTVWTFNANVENVAQYGTILDNAQSSSGSGYTITSPSITTANPGEDIISFIFSNNAATPQGIGYLTGDVDGNLNATKTSSIMTPVFLYNSNSQYLVASSVNGNAVTEANYPWGATETWGQPARVEGPETVNELHQVSVGSTNLTTQCTGSGAPLCTGVASPFACCIAAGYGDGTGACAATGQISMGASTPIASFPSSGTLSIAPSNTVTYGNASCTGSAAPFPCCTGLGTSNGTGACAGLLNQFNTAHFLGCVGGSGTISGPVILSSGGSTNVWSVIRMAFLPQFTPPQESVGTLNPGPVNATVITDTTALDPKYGGTGVNNGPQNVVAPIPNAVSTPTQTVANKLVSTTNVGGLISAIITPAGATSGAIGICNTTLYGGTCGITGSASVVTDGIATCVFDGTTTAAGDIVQISSSVAGDCHDTGSATCPASGQVIGQVGISPSSGATLVLLTNPCARATPISTHTLTGTTPTAVCSSTTIPSTDIENQLLAANVTTDSLPAAGVCADGEVLHWFVQQSASGGPYTLPTGTVGPLTAGAGTIVAAAAGVTCPTIGTTQSATVPSELHMNIVYRAPLTEWVVEGCQGVR